MCRNHSTHYLTKKIKNSCFRTCVIFEKTSYTGTIFALFTGSTKTPGPSGLSFLEFGNDMGMPSSFINVGGINCNGGLFVDDADSVVVPAVSLGNDRDSSFCF
mmetsp:Transcript_1998/g.2498  ORF Transcript_1998/g.2498 Transcript_1998/m.2498 type:complete len:103 (-) Transcript_1998:543-851(-)